MEGMKIQKTKLLQLNLTDEIIGLSGLIQSTTPPRVKGGNPNF